MAKKKTYKVDTNPPKGLTLKRSASGNKTTFTCGWKIGDTNYGRGQTFEWNVNGGKWNNVDIRAATTSKSVEIDLAKYCPTTSTALLSFSFRVKGRRSKYTKGSGDKKKTYDPQPSKWSQKTFTIAIPAAPTVTATLSDQHSNVCTFSGSAVNKADTEQIFRQIQYQTILVKECNITDGSKVKGTWTTGTAGATYSVTYTEDTAILATASYTRWFRVRARGSRGDSAWVYSKHVYGRPISSKGVTATVAKRATTGYTCTVKWTADTSASHPISQTVVQYAFAVPDANMACPSGASWQDANTSKDTGGQDGACFNIDGTIGEDQVLFVRVNTKWDNNVTYGTPVVASGGVGVLKKPTNLTVDANQQTHRATITATNASSVPDSFLVVTYKTKSDPNGFKIGIIPHGSTSVTVQCPDWSGESPAFVVQAAVGSYKATQRGDGVTSYTVSFRMYSYGNGVGGTVPAAPSDVELSKTETPGTIHVTFDWAWSAANAAEIAWADHADAWESTDEPDTYRINNTHASAWNISGLATGQKWYVRVRLVSVTADGETYGEWSELVEIDLSSAPAVPVMSLSEGVITKNGSVTASWVFVTTDGTDQSYAEVAEVITTAGVRSYNPIASVETAQYVEINAKDMGWNSGESHALAVRVVSASGIMSDDWSEPVTVTVADPIHCTIVSHSLVEQTIMTDTTQRIVNSLTVLPLTVRATGAGTSGTTMVVIERSETYEAQRPDETEIIGYAGETIAIRMQAGEDEITIDQDDLLGHLDDGASYTMTVAVSDGLGQSASESIEFEVHWTDQAKIPNAQVEIDSENMVAFLTPVAPAGAAQGSSCDIYRLSVDKPELIYPNASWGTKYVDPYPVIGEFGGHRFVYKTLNGDYITADNEYAWVDTAEDEGDLLNSEFNVIDFGSGRVMLQYNVDLSNSWKKDFQETQYLGGSVQGDWNPGVSRSSGINSVAIVADDQETIEAMRRLATYSGICHVRTKDGSSYSADVQVSENYNVDKGHKIASFSLRITRVDPDGYEGITYSEWKQTHEEV